VTHNWTKYEHCRDCGIGTVTGTDGLCNECAYEHDQSDLLTASGRDVEPSARLPMGGWQAERREDHDTEPPDQTERE